VTIDEANKGLDDCLHERFVQMEESDFKKMYQATYQKCIKEIAPIKQMCDTTEQKEVRL
jgi:hypothetical protein